MTIWRFEDIPHDDGYADLSSHDVFALGAPHRTFKRLRDESPLHWQEFTSANYDNAQGFWSVTRHEDILALNKNNALMSSARGIRMEDQSYEEYLARRTFQETDPPAHTRTRMLVAKAFSKPVVALFEEQIREICVDILDKALQPPDGEIDGTKDIARQLPMRMLGRIIGTPDEDLEWLVERGDALIANTDSDFTQHVLDKVNTDAYRLMPFRSPAGAELFDYAQRLMDNKRAQGDTTGILHLITQPDASGNVISDAEFRNFFCLLVAAGNDTTRYSIAAALHALANQTDLLTQLKAAGADDPLWDSAADEFIRWAAPASYFRRTATADYDMHGKTIRAGDKVLLWFASGNRDERAFDEPMRVKLDRSLNGGMNRHLSFGQGGAHVCLGMWLARLELRVLLQTLVSRIAAIEQTAPHAFLRSNFVGGIKNLPLRLVKI